MSRDGVFDHGFPSKVPGFIANGTWSPLNEHLVDCNIVDSACNEELHAHGVQQQIRGAGKG